ncbi:MAG: HEAT repeat domain-containing protein, partial [Planctomycetota bacterium JB042]
FAFEEGLKHEDPGGRAQCAWRLGEMGRVAAIPVLFWRLRYEVDNTVRLWMVDALSRLGTDAQVDVLIELLDDGRTAEGAAEIALRLARAAGEEVADDPSWDDVKELVGRIRDRWRETGLPAGRDPIVLDPELEARLAGCVADLTEYQLRLVDYARTALTGVGALPLPLLRRSLAAEEFYLRFHSIEVVRDIGHPAAALGDALLPLLDDPPCRVVAMEALGEFGYAPAEAPLRAALTDPDPEVRVAAAGALGPLGAAGAVEDLRRILTDEGADLDLRVRAAFSLALLEGGGDGLLFLAERRRAEDYHAPTLDELLERVRSAVDGV